MYSVLDYVGYTADQDVQIQSYLLGIDVLEVKLQFINGPSRVKR
jgi:hypothetical protein